jgi:2-dehydro-3-deoxy-L-rhamnonate dehydrogenase (NAD+)
MDNVIGKLGHVSVVVANAGIGGQQAPSGDYTDEGWHRVISVNLDGVFYTQRAAIRAMKAGGRGGSVINMASILGPVGFASSSADVAAKHGVVGLTETAAGSTLPMASASTLSAPASSTPRRWRRA